MRITMLAFACAAALGACAKIPASTVAGTLTTAVADGQLFCQTESAITALQAFTGSSVAAVLAKGATAAAVDEACALIGGIAVSPPSSGTAATATIALPPSITIPLAAR